MARFRKLGCGKILRMAWPLGSIRLAGTRLPVNGEPVVGSLTTISRLLRSKLWEKSPRRSSAVGTVSWATGCEVFSGQYSCDQKKNSLLRSLVNVFGMYT